MLSVDNLVATGGTITDLGEGNFEFTPVEDLNGSFTLTFNVVDGKGGITPATTTFTLEAVNDPPERTKGNISNLTVLEDSGLTKLGLTGLEYSPGGGADEESQVPLVYKLTALPEATLGSIELADGTAVALDADGVFELSLTDLGGLNFKPVADANGTSELEFTVTDTDGGVLTETISINVAAVNDAPRLTATQKSLSNGVEDTVTRSRLRIFLLASRILIRRRIRHSETLCPSTTLWRQAARLPNLLMATLSSRPLKISTESSPSTSTL